MIQQGQITKRTCIVWSTPDPLFFTDTKSTFQLFDEIQSLNLVWHGD